MIVKTIIGAIMLGLFGLLIISVILMMALDDREWTYKCVLVFFVLIVAMMFVGLICQQLGLLNVMI